MWKQSDLRKIIIWTISFFEEDNGKASMKRLIAVILSFNVSYTILHEVRNVSISEWGNSITFFSYNIYNDSFSFSFNIYTNKKRRYKMKFIKYYFSFVINWTWTIASIFFMIKLIYSGLKGSPLFFVLALIPVILLLFNIQTEYNVYKGIASGNNYRLISKIDFIICYIILAAVIIILIINNK